MPPRTPKQIIDRMVQLIEETSPKQGETTPITEGADPIAQKHKEAIWKGEEKS